MSKGPKNLTSTQQTTIDPTLKARQDQLWGTANNLAQQPYQPYDPSQRFQDFTPDQLASFQAARNAAGAGQGEIDSASQIGGLLGQFGAPQVDFGGAGSYTAADPSRVTAQQIPGGAGSSYAPSNVTAGKFTDADISKYMNPFIGNVVDTSLSDIERARKEAITSGESRAAAAGAFGGSRHGVADSLTNREFAQTAASTSAGLRKAGFDTASGLAVGDINRKLAADQGNQGAGLTAGLAGQSNILQRYLANQGADLSAQQSNQAAGTQVNEFNAGQKQSGAQFDSSGRLQADTTNAGNALNAAGVRLNAANLLGTLGGERQRMLAGGADLLSRIGGQQQAFGQAGKDFNYQQFGEKRALPYQQLDLLSRLLGGQQYGSSSTSTQPNPQRGSLASSILGIGGTLLGGPLGGLAGKALGGLFGGGQDSSPLQQVI